MVDPIFTDRERQTLQRDFGFQEYHAILGDEGGVVFDQPLARPDLVRIRYKTAAGFSLPPVVPLAGSFQGKLNPGRAVIVGWQDDEWCVLRPDRAGQIVAGQNPLKNNPAGDPAKEFTPTTGIIPLSSTPTSPESTFVTLASLFWIWGRTVTHYYASDDDGSGGLVGKIDLLAYIPAAGSHRIAALFLKKDNTPEVVASTTKTMDIPIDADDVQECLTGSSAFSIPGPIWYLHDAQTTITQADYFADMRQFIFVPQDNYVTTRVVTAAGDVTVALTDFLVVLRKTIGAATVVNLPASPTVGLKFEIKDGKGDAALHNITITPASGTIEGAATYVMNVNYQSQTVVYDGTEWVTI